MYVIMPTPPTRKIVNKQQISCLLACCPYYLVNRIKKAPFWHLLRPIRHQKKQKKVCGALSFPTSLNYAACVCSRVELSQVTGLRFNFGSKQWTLDECAAFFDSITVLFIADKDGNAVTAGWAGYARFVYNCYSACRRNAAHLLVSMIGNSKMGHVLNILLIMMSLAFNGGLKNTLWVNNKILTYLLLQRFTSHYFNVNKQLKEISFLFTFVYISTSHLVKLCKKTTLSCGQPPSVISSKIYDSISKAHFLAFLALTYFMSRPPNVEPLTPFFWAKT